MRREHAHLLFIAGFTSIAIGIALAGEAVPMALRVLFGLPLALFLPGYALAQALFKRAFVPSARLMLALGLSFMVTVLGAFVLHFTPTGIRTESWAVLLGSITLVSCLMAYMQQSTANSNSNSNSNSYKGSAAGVEVEAVVTAPLRKLSYAHMALFAVAGIAVVVAVVIASIGGQYPQTELVNLWVKRETPTSDTGRIQVGVDNVNSPALVYRVRVQRGAFVVREWPALEIATGTTWVGTVELTANPPGEGALEALLYRADHPQQVFRRVSLSIEK